jgi:hypothetical protein
MEGNLSTEAKRRRSFNGMFTQLIEITPFNNVNFREKNYKSCPI